MEGIAWLIMCAYVVVGCFYYVASLNRIVSFITTMKADIADVISLLIVLMALILAWPFLLWLDMIDYLEQRREAAHRDYANGNFDDN